MNIAEHVQRVARRTPERVAVLYQGQSTSYGELETQASRCADGLRRLGLAAGDRVALLLPNCPEFITAYLGIQKLGGIAVSVSALLKRAEVTYILGDSGSRMLFTDREGLTRVSREDVPALEHVVVCGGASGGAGTSSFAALLEGGAEAVAAVELPADAPAAIVYSSGTTGFPKGVVLSQSNLQFNSRSKVRYCGIRSVDRMLLFVPMSHCFGQNAIMNAAFSAGAALVVHRAFDLEAIKRSIEADGVTMFFAVPSTYVLLQQRASPEAFRSVRYFFSAAASLPAEIATRWQERFLLPIHEGYGLTETSPFACYNHELSHRVGSIGAPIEGVQMRIADPESGSELPVGEIGEILVRGPNVMLGYWKRPEDTAAALRDGWLRTGDLGRVDAEGYFFLVDRLKDMINVGGLKVFPAEVENVLYRHEGVAESAVYGKLDPVLGERVAAKIVPKPQARLLADELRAHCREYIADYKVPTEIELVESLPKTASGKILRRELRAASSGERREGSRGSP